jgi:hypothetical protein
MEGVFTLDDADAMSQDDEQLQEQFEDLSQKFYCVLKNIMKHEDELGENAQQMVEKAFADYDMRLRDLFGLSGEIPDEDETVGDVQRNGYSLQEAPGMVTPKEYAPYSLYASDDDAEFAFNFGNWVSKQGTQLGNSLNKAQRFGTSIGDSLKKGNWSAAGKKTKAYYTRKLGDVATRKDVTRMRWDRVGGTAAGIGAVGAAGYGTYKLGRAGLGAVGIGRKEDSRRNRY